MADIALESIEDVEFPDDIHETSTGISNSKLAMWVYLASDCMLFGGLISTYLLYKNRPGSIPGLAGSPVKASELFNIPFTSMTSFILLMSSLTMVLAVNSIMAGDTKRMRLWLTSTCVLGGLFLAGQVYEFTEFVNEGLGFTSNVSASAFYTLTGFHGAHVAVGIIVLLSAVGFSFRKRLDAEAVEVLGLYWHFVDIVWVVIFAIVYLIP
ncbi:MAG TPA: cytochrome c oxidase subunit 3 [Microthrixaceae bacterium]|nr:cytochrome c oxidase subunit 3 [Microthrixaceae bacterium]